MPRTFTNEPLTRKGRHSVKTEAMVYIMGPSWIDTTTPSDMMDYDLTGSIEAGKESRANDFALWAQQQAGHPTFNAAGDAT